MNLRHLFIIVMASVLGVGLYTSNLNPEYSGITNQLLPNPTLTPGATNPDITQATIGQTICNKNWSTKSIRPPSSYTIALKKRQIKQYGFTDTDTSHYEEDHLISLELGGHPTDPKNLWPESYQTTPGAKNKDSVENLLHKEVCDGTITLQQAQEEISTDWTRVYASIQGKLGATVSDADDDDL